MKLNQWWNSGWALDEATCPCDVHFNEWISSEGLRDRIIFHFGTGSHHIVGQSQAQNGSGNVVMGITASLQEYEAYINLSAANPIVARNYLAFFGDIYLLEPRLLPEFDVVTLFHLCEFGSEGAAGEGAKSDREVVTLFARKLRRGGRLLLYTGSFAFDKAQEILDLCVVEGLSHIGNFKSLAVYEKKRSE